MNFDPFISTISRIERQAHALLADSSDIALNLPTKYSYLSTPLRLKHFAKLSPSTLQLLLSSPSIRVSTPDNSADAFSHTLATAFSTIDPPRSSIAPRYRPYRDRDPHVGRRTGISIPITTRNLDGFENIGDIFDAIDQALSRGLYSQDLERAFHDDLLLQWLALTPYPTVHDCVCHFQAYLNDPLQSDLVVSSIKRLTQLNDEGILLPRDFDSSAANTSAIPLASPIMLLKAADRRVPHDDSFGSDDSFYLGDQPADLSFENLRISTPNSFLPLHKSRNRATQISPTTIKNYQIVMNELMGVVDISPPSYNQVELHLPSPPSEWDIPSMTIPSDNNKAEKVQELLGLADRLDSLADHARAFAIRMAEMDESMVI